MMLILCDLIGMVTILCDNTSWKMLVVFDFKQYWKQLIFISLLS